MRLKAIAILLQERLRGREFTSQQGNRGPLQVYALTLTVFACAAVWVWWQASERLNAPHRYMNLSSAAHRATNCVWRPCACQRTSRYASREKSTAVSHAFSPSCDSLQSVPA